MWLHSSCSCSVFLVMRLFSRFGLDFSWLMSRSGVKLEDWEALLRYLPDACVFALVELVQAGVLGRLVAGQVRLSEFSCHFWSSSHSWCFICVVFGRILAL